MSMNVDVYIESFSEEIQFRLRLIREQILNLTPEAIESISYKMPAYKYKQRPLIYFAGYKDHIGLYATPSTHEKFASDLSMYKQGKGSVQFPHNQTLPIELISKIIEFKRDEINKK